MIVYHTTTFEAAAAILADGFQDASVVIGETDAGQPFYVTGVFVADYPVDANQGAKGDRVLQIVLPDDFDLARWAIEEEGLPVWEWCVPAALLNTHGQLTDVTDQDWNVVYPPQMLADDGKPQTRILSLLPIRLARP